MRVHGFLLHHRLLAPRRGEQLALGEHLARTAHEGAHKVELSAREAHGRAVHGERARVLVGDPGAEPQRALGARCGKAACRRGAGCGVGSEARIADAAQLHLDTRQQLVEIEGLHQVVVGTRAQKRHLVGGRALCGRHDDGRGSLRAYERHHVLSGQPRQHEIAYHEVEAMRAQHKARLGAREHRRARIALLREERARHIADGGIVLHHEHGRLRGGRGGGGGRGGDRCGRGDGCGGRGRGGGCGGRDIRRRAVL